MQADSIANANSAPSPLPLQVESLVKRFGPTTAVNGASLFVRGGECLGLLGPNGAGKSTLIRSIVGRVIPDAGRVAGNTCEVKKPELNCEGADESRCE